MRKIMKIMTDDLIRERLSGSPHPLDDIILAKKLTILNTCKTNGVIFRLNGRANRRKSLFFLSSRLPRLHAAIQEEHTAIDGRLKAIKIKR